MDSTISDDLMTKNSTVLCAGMLNGPRLTPTGKISHAKTRVYTQRYRKEWEQMPDFKGWLTSVPFQATRAFCTYCNKNLHAHRLSLLKHTCTMKHQRAALSHQNDVNSKQSTAVKISEIEAGYKEDREDDGVVHIVEKMTDQEVEDENEEYEYIVERLDIDDEEVAESPAKRGEQECSEQEEEEEEEGIEENYEDGGIEHDSMDEDDPLPVKKIKIEGQDNNCRDALAEAMAHVHGEYLDGTDDQVDLDMVVTSEDGVIQESEHDVSMGMIEHHEVENEDQDCEKLPGVKTSAEGDFSEVVSEAEAVPARLLKVARPDESSNSLTNAHFKPSTMNVLGSPFSAVPSSSGQTKTFKLNTGKTITVRSGTQYIVSNVQGNHRTFSLAERKPEGQGQVSVQKERIVKIDTPQGNSVASTSQQSPVQKPAVKTETTKKPCISTHVMDTSKGLPIGGLQVSLYKLMNGRWTFLNESNTAANGRCTDLVDSSKSNFTAGRYKIHFDVDKYFTLRRIETMYPFIEIVFDVKNPTGNYHIPVLLSPFGYTTYRGSDR